MKNFYSFLSSLFFAFYLTYVVLGAFVVYVMSSWQNAVSLLIIGLPFFILSIIYNEYCYTPKHPGYYGFLYLSPEQNDEEKMLTKFFIEYTSLFTQLCTPKARINIAHICVLTEPYQSADEATWDHYANCIELITKTQKGHN